MDMNLDNQSSKPRDSGSPSMDASVNVSFSSPPALIQQHSANQSGTSDRKRNRRTMDDDGALDDILCQSKLYVQISCFFSQKLLPN
jgi:hypothetical protein